MNDPTQQIQRPAVTEDEIKRLTEASKKFRDICREYDLLGAACLCLPAAHTHTLFVEPSWSAVMQGQGGQITIPPTSQRFADPKDAEKARGDTYTALAMVGNWAQMLSQGTNQTLQMLKDKWHVIWQPRKTIIAPTGVRH